MSTFKFQPKWKEELVVSGPAGSFVLEFPMGILSTYLPTEAEWQRKAPAWAKDLYPTLKQELEVWCKENDAKFIIDATADVFVLASP